MAYAYVAIITFLVLLSCGSCVHESRADLDDAANQLRKLLLQEIMINDAHNAQEDTVEQQLNNKLNEEDIFAENVRDDEKDTSNGMDRVLEQFTKLIQGFADSESEEPASLAADEEPETDAEGKVCIKYIEVTAKTGSLKGSAQRYGAPPKMVIGIHDVAHEATLEGNKYVGAMYTKQLSLSSFQPSNSIPSCLTQDMITSVKLKEEGGDGWYVAWIKTDISGSNHAFTALTRDDNFNKWIDGDEAYLYSYDATLVPLTLHNTNQAVCIKYIKVTAKTGSVSGAAQRLQYGAPPKMVIGINNLAHEATLEGDKNLGAMYTIQLSLSSFKPSNSIPSCLTQDMITSVKLKAVDTDGWYISNIKTEVSAYSNFDFTLLTNNDNFNKWVDGNEADLYTYDATLVPLTLQKPNTIKDTPHCGYGIPVCECEADATQCIFNMEIDEIMTFTSYQKLGVGLSEGLAVRAAQGVLYNIDERSGSAGPHPIHSGRQCAELDKEKCTDPQYVDGKTYRMAVGVNGQIPGPTIIVHHGQEVVIHVHNNMSTEGISIHWHGVHQRGTPWMDGVGQVTQCQIGPSSSYSYTYIASPSGSFWYHSHSGAQRTDGFFGALIVKERPNKLNDIKTKLGYHGVKTFIDDPAEHSITLVDWNQEASLNAFTQSHAGLGFFENIPIGQVPNDWDEPYEVTRSIERGGVGALPFYSGLINGKGRHNDVPYSKTRLSEFRVQQGNRYRFRLIGAQGLYAYKFSIDGHRLTVVATDGYWIEPVNDVDYIIIHTGERYDFILDANQDAKNYWLRAETLEINLKGGPPYRSLGHVAEGILRYVNSETVIPISSTQYEEIKLGSPPIQCSSSHKCHAVNCPFKDFHPAYYTECTNVDKLRLLEETDEEEMPAAYPSPNCPDCLHFFNFNFEGHSATSSVNGRSFLLPPAPPQTQYDDYLKQGTQCDLETECNPTSLACICTQVRDIPYDKTVQFVLTAMGTVDAAHPIHLHGHTFHVVKIGYPEYDDTTGFVAQRDGPVCDNIQTKLSIHNPDIQCGDSCGGSVCPINGCDPNRCTKPGWTNGNSPDMQIHSKTIRKDTVILPAGGYVVINFKSDNPGQWFLHCHIEVHQLSGMALIINEAQDKQELLQLPDNLNKCGDFNLSMEQYLKLTKGTAKAANFL